jgi:hypothetical protein
VSDFFEPPPAPTEPREYRPPPWIAPPPNVLGSAVPLEIVLARTDAVAIVVAGATAYPTGLEFTVSVRRRGKGRTALEEHPLAFHHQQGGDLPDELLRFGVQFADGRKATSVGGLLRPLDQKPSHPVLTPRGGGGGGGQWELGFWLYPLPPAGPIAFVCEWPAEGIELTRQEVEADVIREAAERAEVLWEEQGNSSGSAVVQWSTGGRTVRENP